VLFTEESNRIRQGKKAKIGLRLNRTTRQFDAKYDWFVGEISSILAAQLGFLPSLDHPIRSRQHIWRNR
jgi:hypothetical protein